YYALFASLITVIRGSEHANITCRTATRSTEECKDYLEHCDVVKCDHADFVGFAIANCARTCNFCFPNSTLPPEYACTDLLDDCHERMKMCRDIDFIGIMAVFCPRLCSLCTYKPSEGQCQELVPE
ncbi:hypothetical protein Angca_001472, partial [Angiostrongylus cantonensis]